MSVGDRVRVRDDFGDERLRGAEGVIIKEFAGIIAVKFEETEGLPVDLLHDCAGECPNSNGRYFVYDQLELTQKSLEEVSRARRDAIWRAIQEACR